MKHLKVLSALSLLAVAGGASAEVAGSAAIASSYHWRGFDLGSGTPAVSGELRYTVGGFYAASWASSGDTAAGTEWDLYAGYAGAVGSFTYDVSYISYIYPTGTYKNVEGFGDFAEVIGKVGLGPVGAFLYYNVAGASKTSAASALERYAFVEGEYMYYGLTAKYGAFSAVLGKHDAKKIATVDGNGDPVFVKPSKGNPGGTGNATHLDLTYAYNDNLAFTVSGILDSKFANVDKPKPKFVVAYTVPFKM